MAIRISHILEAKHKGVPGLPGMRSVYWDHIKEAQARLSESDSSLSKTRVLELAREEWGPKVLNRFKVQNPLIIDAVSDVSHWIWKIPVCGTTVKYCILTLRWKTHPARIANMKNLSRSELSRRRLVPAKKPRKPRNEPAENEAPNPPPIANEVQDESNGSDSEVKDDGVQEESSGSKAAADSEVKVDGVQNESSGSEAATESEVKD